MLVWIFRFFIYTYVISKFKSSFCYYIWSTNSNNYLSLLYHLGKKNRRATIPQQKEMTNKKKKKKASKLYKIKPIVF